MSPVSFMQWTVFVMQSCRWCIILNSKYTALVADHCSIVSLIISCSYNKLSAKMLGLTEVSENEERTLNAGWGSSELSVLHSGHDLALGNHSCMQL